MFWKEKIHFSSCFCSQQYTFLCLSPFSIAHLVEVLELILGQCFIFWSRSGLNPLVYLNVHRELFLPFHYQTAKAIVYIEEMNSMADVTFPSVPQVASLLMYDDTARAKDRTSPIAGYPVICITVSISVERWNKISAFCLDKLSKYGFCSVDFRHSVSIHIVVSHTWV